MQTEMKPWIILITHGKLGAEVKGSAEMIAGELENVYSLSLMEGTDPMDLAMELKELLDNYESGMIMTQGVNTVIAGRPNAGKSTLMNMLSGKEKSIVTHIEGTTRDIVENSVRLGSLVLHLSDTAGLRESDDVVEAIGIKKALERLGSDLRWKLRRHYYWWM